MSILKCNDSLFCSIFGNSHYQLITKKILLDRFLFCFVLLGSVFPYTLNVFFFLEGNNLLVSKIFICASNFKYTFVFCSYPLSLKENDLFNFDETQVEHFLPACMTL